jgi:4-amino-4-deoxychorismate lyase
MDRFIETIRIRNSVAENLSFHIQRMRDTSNYYGFNLDMTLVNNVFNNSFDKGIEYKLRIIYGKDYFSYSYEKYNRREIRSLKIIEAKDLLYGFKFENREEIDRLLLEKGEADDIIITKGGYITDSSFSNLVFLSKDNKLYTPSTYLLNGIMRKSLIQSSIIQEKEIRLLSDYKGVYLINAMNSIEDNQFISINSIL